MWSWVCHRISADDFLSCLSMSCRHAAGEPATYNAVLAIYKTPIVGLMGWPSRRGPFSRTERIRAILIDFWSEGPRHQRLMC